MSYITISSQEKHNFSLCSCFHAHPTTLLLKILGGPMHGRSPHLKFGGAVPPVPPRSPPLYVLYRVYKFSHVCLSLQYRLTSANKQHIVLIRYMNHKPPCGNRQGHPSPLRPYCISPCFRFPPPIF